MAVITIQGNDYDSYVSLSEAKIYLLGRIGASEWTAASQTTQQQAVITGTRWINRILQRLTDETLIPDPADDPGTPAPDLIKDATSEAAYALVVDSTIQDKSAATSDNNKVLKAGSALIERFRPMNGTALPTIAQQYVNEWIADVGGSTISAGLASGVDGTSCFLDMDKYGVDVGYP